MSGLRERLAVYLVSAPDATDREVVEVARAAVAGGAGIVQVRAKGEQPDDAARRAALALAVREACPAALVVVNDDLDAAALVDGVHVGPDDADPVTCRRRLGRDAIVGWSLHDPAQLDDAAALAACSYVAVSPVWATSTKPDHSEPWGLDGVRRIVAALRERGHDLPVVGIGGIDHGNAAEVVAAGADGVAVVTAITAAPDPLGAARALRASVDGGRA